MKRTLCSIAAILVTVAVYSQNSERAGWSPEFSAKAFVSVYHGSYEITAGARVDDNVFGLGSGLGLEFWDAIPAHVKKIPLYGFYRRYVPLGRKELFLLFGELTVGGEYVYKIDASQEDIDAGRVDTDKKWKGRATVTPGIAIRPFGKINLYIAPTLEILSHSDFMPGVTAGINVGF